MSNTEESQKKLQNLEDYVNGSLNYYPAPSHPQIVLYLDVIFRVLLVLTRYFVSR